MKKKTVSKGAVPQASEGHLPSAKCAISAATRPVLKSFAAPNGARRRFSVPQNMRLHIVERLSYTRLAIEKK